MLSANPFIHETAPHHRPHLRKPAPRANLASGATKALCREYTAGYVHDATDLAYGKRINGPKGIGALEKPSEIMAGRVHGKDKPMGYGSGIEDLAYHNALLLYALCDAEEKTGEPLFAEMAHRAFRGLVKMLDITPHRGFVPRGPHPDGKSFYKDSSLDQHSLYLCSLWRFYRSRLITDGRSTPGAAQKNDVEVKTLSRRGHDHHPRCYSLWVAGAGVKRGHFSGQTDDFLG